MGAFSARQVKNAVVLDWNTYSEVQNLGFEIERRQVGGEPTLIKSFTDDPALQAKAPWGANYETTDDEGLANGVYTYDLYQTDQNGIRTHAGTQTVDFSEVSMPTELSISIYPNPAVEIAHIQFSLPADDHVTVTVYDLSGRMLDRILDGDFTSGNREVTYDASHLPSGSYNVVLMAGNKRVMKSFVVNR